VDGQRGRFRTFVLHACEYFLAKQWRDSTRLKRGGGQNLLSLDVAAAEDWYHNEPADPMTPERSFERQWALALLDLAMERLRQEWAVAGKETLFATLQIFLSGERKAITCAQAALELGMSEGAVRTAVHRLRQHYGEILRGQQSTEDEENRERKAEGLGSVHLVGWAQQPTYDATQHVLVWAREIAFEGQPVHTLNYDLRALGRAGVLSMNIIAPMDHLNDIKTAATALGPIAAFNSGSRYTDFVAGTDKDSGYGLAGLVAAGVGVAAAQKFGLLAVVILFAKKAGILIVAGGAAAVAGARKLFRRRA